MRIIIIIIIIIKNVFFQQILVQIFMAETGSTFIIFIYEIQQRKKKMCIVLERFWNKLYLSWLTRNVVKIAFPINFIFIFFFFSLSVFLFISKKSLMFHNFKTHLKKKTVNIWKSASCKLFLEQFCLLFYWLEWKTKNKKRIKETRRKVMFFSTNVMLFQYVILISLFKATTMKVIKLKKRTEIPSYIDIHIYLVLCVELFCKI